MWWTKANPPIWQTGTVGQLQFATQSGLHRIIDHLGSERHLGVFVGCPVFDAEQTLLWQR